MEGEPDHRETPGYLIQQFIYPSGTSCAFNYFALGWAVSGLIMLGWTHLVICLALITIERTVKHNVELVRPWPGVSGIYSGFAGYILGAAIWGGGSMNLLMVGLVISVWNIAGGLNAFNLFAHFMPVAIGLIISYLTVKMFDINIRRV